jgi:hypothetical protein
VGSVGRVGSVRRRRDAEEGLDGGEGSDRVSRLVPAEQREEDLLVVRAQPAKSDLLPTDGDQPLKHPEVDPLDGRGRLHLGRSSGQHLHGLVVLRGQDDR